MKNIKHHNLPLVSIIIPVYNGSNYMKEAIDSALSQTYPNIEVLVVNDGSCDDGKTEKIALSYGEKIRYFIKPNGGVSSALNYGLREMKGEFFSWLSHDDVYTPEKIYRQMSVADEKSIVMCGRKLIDEKSNIIGEINIGKHFKQDCELNCAEAFAELYDQGCFNGCALLIPKKAFDSIGCFDESLRYCQDLLMWTKLFLGGYGLRFLPFDGVLSRVHDKQLTNTGKALYYGDCKYLSDVVLSDICEKSDEKINLLYHFAKYNAKYYNKSVFDACIYRGRVSGLLKFRHIFALRLIRMYGSVRPFLRQIYYKLIKRIAV